MSRKRPWSLARQLIVLQTVMIIVLVAAGVALEYADSSATINARARDKVVSVASTVADAPTVAGELDQPKPSLVLQPFAEQVRIDTDVDFITIMNPAGIRYTHPNPGLIGKQFLGNRAQALAGHVLVETYPGSLGPSVRAVVPVFGADKRVVALVSVGITVRAISAELRDRLLPLAGLALAVLVVGIVGSVLIGRRLHRQTRGVAPAELSTMFSYYQAILHAVREGLVLVGGDGKVGLCNDGARELLGLRGPVEGRAVSELGLPDALTDAFTGTVARADEIHVTDTRVLVVNSAPVSARGAAMGNVITLRDHTDLQTLTGELNTARGFAESLRSQAHESANRLHTVVSLVEIGELEQAVEFATGELEVAQRLTDRVVGSVAEPVLAALLLGKLAEASERGAEIVLTEDTAVEDTAAIEARDLVTILGNLIDNAVDAAIIGGRGKPRVTVTVKVTGAELLLRVADNGPGIADDVKDSVFSRGWSTKDGDRGLGLALVGQSVRKHQGTIDVQSDNGAVFVVRLPLRKVTP